MSPGHEGALVRLLHVLPAVLTALALGAGCGQSTEEELEAVANASNLQRAKIEELAKEGTSAVQPLLENEKKTVRYAAINALGFIKDDPEATRLLVDVVNGEEAEDAYFAIIALARQGAQEAKGIIEHAFKSQEPRRREAACIAVAELGDKSLYPLVLKALQDREKSVRGAAKGTVRRCNIEEALQE